MSELSFSVSRSSGPGGQHVNKVNTKVTVHFDITQSTILTPEQRNTLRERLGARITGGGILSMSSQQSRSQSSNKEEVLRKLDSVLALALTPRKKRKATRPGKAAKERRMNTKKSVSEKKRLRRKRFDD